MEFLIDKIRHLQDEWRYVQTERDVRFEQRFQAQGEALNEARAVNDLALAAALQSVRDLSTEQDRRYEQRFVQQETAVSLALTRVDKEFHEHINSVRTETSAALAAADKAITKSEASTEKQFGAVNEFRTQLADQATRFMPRIEAEQRIGQAGEKIAGLEHRCADDTARINSRLDKTAGTSEGAEKYRATLFAVLAAGATVVGLVFALTGR